MHIFARLASEAGIFLSPQPLASVDNKNLLSCSSSSTRRNQQQQQQDEALLDAQALLLQAGLLDVTVAATFLSQRMCDLGVKTKLVRKPAFVDDSSLDANVRRCEADLDFQLLSVGPSHPALLPTLCSLLQYTILKLNEVNRAAGVQISGGQLPAMLPLPQHAWNLLIRDALATHPNFSTNALLAASSTLATSSTAFDLGTAFSVSSSTFNLPSSSSNAGQRARVDYNHVLARLFKEGMDYLRLVFLIRREMFHADQRYTLKTKRHRVRAANAERRRHQTLAGATADSSRSSTATAMSIPSESDSDEQDDDGDEPMSNHGGLFCGIRLPSIFSRSPIDGFFLTSAGDDIDFPSESDEDEDATQLPGGIDDGGGDVNERSAAAPDATAHCLRTERATSGSAASGPPVTAAGDEPFAEEEPGECLSKPCKISSERDPVAAPSASTRAGSTRAEVDPWVSAIPPSAPSSAPGQPCPNAATAPPPLLTLSSLETIATVNPEAAAVHAPHPNALQSNLDATLGHQPRKPGVHGKRAEKVLTLTPAPLAKQAFVRDLVRCLTTAAAFFAEFAFFRRALRCAREAYRLTALAESLAEPQVFAEMRKRVVDLLERMQASSSTAAARRRRRKRAAAAPSSHASSDRAAPAAVEAGDCAGRGDDSGFVDDEDAGPDMGGEQVRIFPMRDLRPALKALSGLQTPGDVTRALQSRRTEQIENANAVDSRARRVWLHLGFLGLFCDAVLFNTELDVCSKSKNDNMQKVRNVPEA